MKRKLSLRINEMKYFVGLERIDYNHCCSYGSPEYMIPAGFVELCRQANCFRPFMLVSD